MAAVGVGGPDRERRGGGASGDLEEAAEEVVMRRVDGKGGRRR
jgi:hypothetical protein